jgi:hypothetical protein
MFTPVKSCAQRKWASVRFPDTFQPFHTMLREGHPSNTPGRHRYSLR